MSRLKLGIALLTVVLLVASWYAFRPERAFIDTRVNESAPAGATVVAAGRFVPREHKGTGDARISRTATGELVLQLSSFETLNGPDVRVYLVSSGDVENQEQLDAASFVDLGALKGNVGDQNYSVPPGTDVTRYPAVVIWCRRFSANFTTATLAFRNPAGS